MTRIYHLAMQACGVLAALTIGLITLLVAFDVLARNLGVASFPWIVEVSEYSLPLATFLAAPWLLHRNEHVRLDLALNAAPHRLAVALERVADTLGLAVSVVFVWYAMRVIVDSRAIGAMVYKALVFPEWWLFAPVPVCFGLLGVEFARRLICPSPRPSPAKGEGETAPSPHPSPASREADTQ